ncbi:LOW QUALITY PROTEIN: interleukin-18 receptor accessory protein-like [Cottoperca gobio]|uniref:LOW QUALITY PROTEIN: interleukin-18 receptor accessory protein-like n=1 Tax=Cottoperca gobio TaxID=56716 RepID=A0A6J2S8D5_COTGO|nr:LOW QUALITY PROTEIN: interleukin-18 receptor accessory protein-like [Cottoperca gobio]
MQTPYILGFLIFPIFLEGCCVRNRQAKRTGLQLDTLHRHYRAVEGEIFMMPCTASVNQHSPMVWSRTGEGREGNEGTSIACGMQFRAEAKHSGKYTCRSLLSSGSWLFLSLQVVERNSVRCQQEESSVKLTVYIGGHIPCPGFNCSNNTDIIWYKGNEAMSEQYREFCLKRNGGLYLCKVKEYDTEVFFCDRQIIEQGVIWTFRRAVNVIAIPEKASYSPRITYPQSNTTEEVELGQSHNLKCKVYFPVERKLLVQWYMNHGGNMENMTPLHMESPQQVDVKFTESEVIRSAIIEEVTPQHLKHTYTCIANNTVGNSSVTIRLKEKVKVKWPSLVGYPIVSLLLVAGLGIVLHVKWLEIQLIYRSHFQYGKHDGDEKEFDVFLSYVWSPPSAEVEGLLTLFSKKGPDTDMEACLSSMDQLNTEEGKSRLEALLPQVLEDQWGYRLCLLERDVLPGGAYTDDVVVSIQRSQMLICLLSADYLSNSNAVFVLESGVQALLQTSTLKLQLIWTSRASASLTQPDPPLPTLVQRALRVLPSLDWTSGKPAKATSSFWKSLRKAMPDQRVKPASFHPGPMNRL